MNTEFDPRASVKTSYGFANWPRAAALATKMVLHRDFHGGLALSGFERTHRYPVANERNSYTDVYQSSTAPGIALNVSITEYADDAAAHEGLVDHLSTCMATDLPSLSALGIAAGDIGFGGHSELQTQLNFVRGHVHVKIQSTGTQASDVSGYASEIDAQITQAMR